MKRYPPDMDFYDCGDCGEALAVPEDGGPCRFCGCNANADEHWDQVDPIDGVGFANPGGNSALRAATPSNPRNLPCPNCGEPDRLTPIDKARGYQCDACADRAERGW